MPTTLRGDKELLQTFARLVGPKMGKIKRRALEKGLFVVERKIKQNYEQLSKTIPRAIDHVVRAYNDDEFILGIIGINDLEDITKGNPKAIAARGPVDTTSLSPLKQKMLLLEYGADPHIIESDEPLVSFYFRLPGSPKFFGFKVSHPGTPHKAPIPRAFNDTPPPAPRAAPLSRFTHPAHPVRNLQFPRHCLPRQSTAHPLRAQPRRRCTRQRCWPANAS